MTPAEEIYLDPELLNDEDAEADLEDDSDEGAVHIARQQREFVDGCLSVMEHYKEKNPEHVESIEGVTEGILGLIEGNGAEDGYLLVKRVDADFAMVPCTRLVYEEHLRDDPEGPGHDLAVGLLSLFNDINN